MKSQSTSSAPPAAPPLNVDVGEQELRSSLAAAHAAPVEPVKRVAKPRHGNVLMQIHEEVKGYRMEDYVTIRVNGDEHVLVYFYPGFQILVHVADAKALWGEKSRFLKWWKRQLPPGDRWRLVAETRSWLKRRAVRRAQALKAA